MSDSLQHVSAALADRYRIEREAGQGGMATVYVALDLRHHRRVAIKVLRPEVAQAVGADRFLREIETTAALRHPHILPLFDSGEAGGLLFYVMPLVEGETLRERLSREKQLPLEEALQIAGEVADALLYAHGRGIIHRDIKPENILLESGHAAVTDFGIARALGAAGTQSLTQTGMAIGTPAYMSPEQAGGEADIDGRSDLYALGCVTYEMLAGQPPFTGPTVESLVRQHLGAVPRPVTQLRAAVPPAVAAALQRALAKNPADRFATPSAFVAALHATVSSPWPPAPRVTAGVVAVLLFAAAVGGWAMLRRDRGPPLDADVIAVLPFRVGGPATGYLRESMLDLLQARLTGPPGPRTVEPRTLLAAWRQAGGNETVDLSEAVSRKLARRVGAGRVLLGSAIATPTELTLGGSLVRVGDGTELARATVSGAPDSVAVLVNRLTAALLIREAGETPERTAGLAAAPLDALQDYLAGRSASRRGDYFGAMQLFGQAFARDSTFVDAAFAMVMTNAWIGTVFVTAGWRVVPQVARLRDRLSARDLSLFLALPMVGPNYPRPSTHAEVIAQAERAANAALDSPEHWMLLGQMLSHYGAAASQTDWAARSAVALERAIALDSSFTLAINERLFTALEACDTAAIRRFAGLLQRRVTAGFADDFFLWAAARAQGDSAGALRWRNRMEGLSRTDVMQKLTKVALHSAALALPLDDARWAVDTLQREAATEPERVGAWLSRLALRFAAGRTDLGDVDIVPGGGPQGAGTLIQQALIEPVYRPMAAATLARVAAGQYRLPVGGGTIPWSPTEDCFATLYRVAGGDTAGAGGALRRLIAFGTTDHPPIARAEWQLLDFRVCPLLLQVLLEGRPVGHVAWPALDRLDSLMREDPRGFTGNAITAPTAFANYTVARLREAQGDIPAAVAAIRRREVDYFPAYLWSLPAFLRQEGRLATSAGDTAGAIRAYDAYLALRTDPDPPFLPQRDSVVAERAALARRASP